MGMEQTVAGVKASCKSRPGAVKVCKPWPEEIEALQRGSGQNHRPSQL